MYNVEIFVGIIICRDYGVLREKQMIAYDHEMPQPPAFHRSCQFFSFFQNLEFKRLNIFLND
jgi:hypothetical protein